MLTSFWEQTGTGIGQRLAQVSAPAAAFWACGLLIVVLGQGSASINDAAAWLAAQPVFSQVTLLLIVMALFTGSAMLVSRLTEPMLHLLQGYWPPCCDRWADARINKIRQQDAADILALQPLWRASAQGRSLTASECRQLSRLSAACHNRPVAAEMMPTAIGNIIRAAECRPHQKYGLDAVTTWPRLWLVMPESSRLEVGAARASLDSSVGALIWGALFPLFAFPMPPSMWCLAPVAAGLAFAVVAWLWWVPNRAATFAEMADAAYDVHRLLLYAVTDVKRNEGQEMLSGRTMTQLWSGNAVHEVVG